MAVFVVYPLKREQGKICDDWRVEAVFEDSCIVCNLCINTCPMSAIEINLLDEK